MKVLGQRVLPASNAGRSSLARGVVPYLVIAGGLAFLFGLLLRIPAIRVGDGSEYYALYLAIETTLRPWMTAESFSHYGRLVEQGGILGVVSMDHLSQSFPELILGETHDFNHFWFYSALAALMGSLVPFGIYPHTAFLLLHWLLFYVPVILAYRHFGWRGLVVVLLMTIGSPLLWFTNKVHTEFFTYCLLLAATISVVRRGYVLGAICMALASTQNPSLAIVAGFLLCARAFFSGQGSYSFWELVGVVATVLIVFLHPAYYFFRFGVPTPQLLAGGADLGTNLSTAYIWLIDPDIGLFPNWPLGVVLLVGGAWAWRARGTGVQLVDRVGWIYLLVYLVVCLYSHASTVNINSGASPGISRYALWYAPLVFPFALKFVEWLATRKYAAICAVLVVGVLLAWGIRANSPLLGESYTKPTSLSLFIQQRLPGLYDPPPELFLERYSGLGEGPQITPLMAVVGPDCRKVLLVPGEGKDLVAAPLCHFDNDALANLLRPRQMKIDQAQYAMLERSELATVLFAPARNREYKLGAGQDGAFALGAGWSVQEIWGVWSNGDRAELAFPCLTNAAADQVMKIELTLGGFVHQRRAGTKLRIIGGSGLLWDGVLGAEATDVVVAIPSGECDGGMSSISLLVENPESPASVGISSDPRWLGVGLTGFKYL